ncbi:unnamed protein product [Arctia plantaginis]|uniref:Uncharacterized protein n=1 Tax=Arctia plantaginis TaxID=874455 RepID=A0A8S0YZ14_ARCPL|nr:unnamed protein product [Arctia plantaginis]
MSRLTANATPPRQTTSSDKERTRAIASSVERPCRKPNWLSDKSGPTRDRCWLIRAAITLSKSFATSSNRHIGRNAEGESAALPGFWISTSLASFQPAGNA